MTLYRINLDPNGPESAPLETQWWLSDGAGWLVAVEPTLQYCIRHRAMALEFAPQWCTNTGYQDRMGKKNPCVMVDAWIGEPA